MVKEYFYSDRAFREAVDNKEIATDLIILANQLCQKLKINKKQFPVAMGMIEEKFRQVFCYGFDSGVSVLSHNIMDDGSM